MRGEKNLRKKNKNRCFTTRFREKKKKKGDKDFETNS